MHSFQTSFKASKHRSAAMQSSAGILIYTFLYRRLILTFLPRLYGSLKIRKGFGRINMKYIRIRYEVLNRLRSLKFAQEMNDNLL